jgi:hypothetical protein
LRALGLRIALLCMLVATVLATHVSVAKPALPFALIDSFDRAFALVYDAAERKVAALEATSPAPRRDVFALLRELERIVIAECDVAAAKLDVELAISDSWSLERRHAVLGCVEHHLGEARKALDRTTDPDVRAEYLATCERLREVRRLI